MVCLWFSERFFKITLIQLIFNVFLKMSNNGKKIAFSFSKVKKPALLRKIDADPKEKIDYVDCFDGSKGKFSYKGNIRIDETVKEELVIPMPTSSTSSDIVRSKIEKNTCKNVERIGANKVQEDNITENETSQQPFKNLEELAAHEILSDTRNHHVSNKSTSKLIIKAKELPLEASENDIDYNNVPVTEFGFALLRGMGWRPDQGIGKEPRIVEAASPNLRPKGLGLGAQLNTNNKN